MKINKALILGFFLYLNLFAQFPRTVAVNSIKIQETDLQTAILKISQLYDVNILYSDDLLAGITVSCQIIDKPIDETLIIILKDTEIAFRTESKQQIILYPKENQNIDIYGWVLDGYTGESLPYANITLEGTSRGTSTNGEGRFTLLDVPGSSTLLTDYIGYSSSQTFIDDTDLSPVLYLTLTPENLESDPVVVRDKSMDLFAAGKQPGELTVNTMLFDQLPVFAGRDLMRSLTYLPGVDQKSNSSTVLNIRGGLPSENLVSLDGITLYHMDHAFGILSAVPTTIVKDTRLYKSNFPAKFGGKLSAVVEMTGKTGDFQQAHIDFETNEMAAQGMVQLPLSGYATLFLSGRHSLNTYLAEDLYQTINKTPPFLNDFVQTIDNSNSTENRSPEISFWDTYAKASITPGNKDLINFSVFRSQDVMNAGRGELNAFSSREWMWSNSGLSASWFRVWSKTLQTDLTIAQSKYDIEQDSSSTKELYLSQDQGSRLNNSIDDFSLSLDNQWTGIKNHHFSAGYQFQQVKTDFNEWHPQFSQILAHGIDAQLNSFYAQDEWQITDKLMIRPALRITHFDLAEKYFYSPRFSARYALSADFTLKASAGRYYQFVSNFGYEFPNYIGQLSWLVNDNTLLKPGKSIHTTFGFDWKSSIFNLDVEIYQKQSDGLIEQINTVKDNSAISPALVQRKALSQGVDVFLGTRFQAIEGWFGYSYNKSEVEAEGVSPYPLSGSSPHSLKAILQYNWAPLVFAISGFYSSGEHYSLPVLNSLDNGSYVLTAPTRRNTEQLSANTRLDLSINYHYKAPWYNLNLGVSIYNILDTQNTWYKSFFVENDRLISRDINKLGFTPTIFLRFGF